MFLKSALEVSPWDYEILFIKFSSILYGCAYHVSA